MCFICMYVWDERAPFHILGQILHCLEIILPGVGRGGGGGGGFGTDWSMDWYINDQSISQSHDTQPTHS